MKSKIITLCGSARFESHFHLWNKVLTLAGHTVFGLGAWPSIEGGKDWYTPEDKLLLDEVHKLKILRSEAILVLNVGDYIGESTRAEIAWARALGVDVYAISVFDESPRKILRVGVDVYAIFVSPKGHYRNPQDLLLSDRLLNMARAGDHP